MDLPSQLKKQLKGKQNNFIKNGKQSQCPIQIKPTAQPNSLQIAKQFIHNTKGYNEIFIIYKNKKSHNYQAFSKHICDILKCDKMNFQNSYNVVTQINEAIKPDINTAGNQPKSIFDGFASYWKTVLKPQYNLLQNTLIKDIQKFSNLLIPSICKFLDQIGNIYDVKNYVVQDMVKHIDKIIEKKEKPSKKEAVACLMIISTLKIYEQFDNTSLVYLAMTTTYQQVAFFFKGIIKNGKQIRGFDGQLLGEDQSIDVMIDQQTQLKKKQYHHFIEIYINECLKRERVKQVQTMIKQNNRNPKHFPILIQYQRKKYIEYIERTYKLHFVQLLLDGQQKQQRRKDFELLCNTIIRKNRFKEALFFIQKYKLQGGQAHKKLIQSNFIFKNSKLHLKNVLIQKDCFGATQLRVFHKETDFVQLQDFGLDQKDVQFIDKQNYNDSIMQKIFNSQIVGIDCQKSGGRNPFDPVQVTLAQISISGNNNKGIQDRIFLFDIISLLKNQLFKKQIELFFTNYKKRLIGQDVLNDIRDLLKRLNIKIKEDNLKKLKIEDTMHIFRQKFKDQSKGSLEFITQFLYKKPLSKYQQCSGWRNRPLRKAQMHYAALDSYLPIKILQKIKDFK